MTLVSDIIRRAHRESNLIPLGASPNTAQTAEALELFNTLILSTVGNEVGDELSDLNYGGTYDQSECIDQWLPDNCRLVFNLDASVTLFADPHPYDGQRLAFVDILGNLATFPVTIDGNGRNIEGLYTALLDTDADYRQWMYRADIGEWVKIASLADSDDVPFPEEFDDYFATMLALRVNPRYGQAISGSSIEAAKRMRSQIRSRYRRKNVFITTDPGLVNPTDYRYNSGSRPFNTGRPWLWGW